MNLQVTNKTNSTPSTVSSKLLYLPLFQLMFFLFVGIPNLCFGYTDFPFSPIKTTNKNINCTQGDPQKQLEYDVLKALYDENPNNTLGSTWQQLADGSICDVCSFSPNLVRCNADGFIEFLAVDGRNISKLPNQITSLIHLETLSFNDNQIDSLPNLDQLLHLRFLFFKNNQLDSLPNLDLLTDLFNINFSNNQIDSLPNLDQLVNLRFFFFDDNQLTQLPSLDQVTDLRTFSVKNNQLTSLPNLNQLTNLAYLYLEGNQLTTLPNIDQLSNLFGIEVGHNQLTEFPNMAIPSPNLRTFEANDNAIQCLPNELAVFCQQMHLSVNFANNPITNIISWADFCAGDQATICMPSFIEKDTLRLPCNYEVDTISTWLANFQPMENCGDPVSIYHDYPMDSLIACGDTLSVHLYATDTCAVTTLLEAEVIIENTCGLADPQKQLEYDALVAIYAANPSAGFGGGWQAVANGTQCDICLLSEVTCNMDGYVTQLKIQQIELVKMPTELNQLIHLEQLMLSFNNIDSLPNLNQLIQLKILDVSNNVFLQHLSNLDQLINLTTLNVANNSIDRLPSLNSLTNLDTLNIGGNIIDSLPNLDKLKQLEVLFAYSNRLDSLPNLDSLTNLIHLFVRGNQLTTFPGLDQLINLQHLDVRFNQLTNFPDLSQLIDLQYLDVSHNQLTTFPNVAALSNLKSFYIGNNQLPILPNWDALVNLQFLDVSNNPIGNLPNLDQLISLKELGAAQNQLTTLPNLDQLTNLERLAVFDNQLTSLPHLDQLVNLEIVFAHNNQLVELPNLGNITNVSTLIFNNNQINCLPSDYAYLCDLVGINFQFNQNPISDVITWGDFCAGTRETICSSTNNCDLSNLNLTDTLASGSYIAISTIVSDAVVPNDTNIIFQAGDTITLLPGFSVASGADFQAIIEDCSQNTTLAKEEIEAIERIQADEKIITPIPPLQMSVQPNPFQFESTLTINLPHPEKIQVTVFDQVGRMVKVLLPRQNLAKGKHTFSFEKANLSSGLYFLVAQTTKEQLVKKVVIQKR